MIEVTPAAAAPIAGQTYGDRFHHLHGCVRSRPSVCVWFKLPVHAPGKSVVAVSERSVLGHGVTQALRPPDPGPVLFHVVRQAARLASYAPRASRPGISANTGGLQAVLVFVVDQHEECMVSSIESWCSPRFSLCRCVWSA